MSYYVYCLRLKGNVECRYIGMTGKPLEQRLRTHFSDARNRVKSDYRAAPEGLYRWLVDNECDIEYLALGKSEWKDEALALEKVFITFLLRLGHRLLNVAHVPEGQRIGYVPTRLTLARRSRALEAA